IVLVNRQAERVFGYTRAELLGQPMEILVPKRFREAHVAHRGGFTNAPRVRPMGAGMALLALRKNTTEFPAEISLSPVETPDGTRVIVAIRDVTERKRIEELTRLREDLMRRAAVRGQPESEPPTQGPRILRWQDLELDPLRRRVFAGGAELNLRRLEYRLLATLLEYPQRIFTRDELLYIVWGRVHEDKRKRTVDTHVGRLRDRLGDRGDAIETVHGMGYRLRAVKSENGA
ncbi:MAG: winged helix-turn-helix domain-containing protein, partial [Polyangiaceae bacterium]